MQFFRPLKLNTIKLTLVALVFLISAGMEDAYWNVPNADRTLLQRPNVLFIAVDDMNDWVGVLGDAQVITPNIDALADKGITFTNAHCAAPVCNPSRVALMSGLRPSTTGVYNNGDNMNDLIPDSVIMLPQYFRQNGYLVAGGGKLFHDVPTHNYREENFDEYFWWNKDGARGALLNGVWRSPYSVPPDPQPDPRPSNNITPITKRNFDWAALDGNELNWPDGQVVAWAEEFLAKDHKRPFFLGVGIFRPHVPWFNPSKYVEMYPLDKIEVPEVKQDDLDDIGEFGQRLALDKGSKHDKIMEFGEWEEAVQAYLASISFADASLGRVLEALDNSQYKDNTIIVFWSDHGYHLGEKQHWHKFTLWERSTRVPFIIVAPQVATAGSKSSRPVSLLDIYPTLVQLVGLPRNETLEGQDLMPLLKDPKAKWEYPAITTHQKGNHAIRTENWRYIRYQTGEEELYDHAHDPNEWNNLSMDPGYKVIIDELRTWLPQEKG